MRRGAAAAVLLLAALAPSRGGGEEPAPDRARVAGGELERFYPVEGEPRSVAVGAFLLDRDPVTNAAFAAFVAAEPRWQRGAAPALFVDTAYLSHWASPVDPGPVGDRPVTQVSWYAARAYCASQGGRLPLEVEWELAAQASATRANARDDPARTQLLLDWYGRPGSAPLRPVGRGEANLWGVRDLHGLVWEWVDDFNSSFAASDGREGGDAERLRFCGSGAVAAADASDYASFMRLAFRSSLKASYTSKNLGFRCAADAPPSERP